MKGKRSIGVNFVADGKAMIRLWAPLAAEVAVMLPAAGQTLALQPGDRGYWELLTDALKPGERYEFLLDGHKERPDPAALAQPDGVHGPSLAIDLEDFVWSDQDWKNPALADYLIYELHTGTFSSEGTFDGILGKLAHLKSLGINAIEIMPVAQFPGERNWGYDGVFPFAVQRSYGGADGLRRLVNACHEQGLAVILDVVYNHFGPEGNYFAEFGPYFTDKHQTPWGNAINFDDQQSEEIRRYFIENVLMWFRDFHLDALRLDAVHAIKDTGEKHILQEMTERMNELIAATGQLHHLIIEFDLNDRQYVEPLEAGGYGIDAQWVDEFHHALRVAAGGERNGYYEDFQGIGHLAKAYRDAYVYDGQYSPHRKKNFGTKTGELTGDKFIVFSQNHDQVGNRMLGERSGQLYGPELQKLMAGAVMVAPYIPMLFMGEEWSAESPFQYFVSHSDPELVAAVRKGRKAEFAAFHAEGEAPDPQALETFNRSKLDWDEISQSPHRSILAYYQALIAIRKRVPALRSPDRQQSSVAVNEREQTLLLERWNGSEQVCCLMNFSADEQTFTLREGHDWRLLLDSAEQAWAGPGAHRRDGSTVIIQPHSIILFANYHV